MDDHRADRFPIIPQTTSPLVVQRTEGVWLVRPDGRRILDAGGGAIVTNIGHGRQDVVEVAAAALSTIDYVLPIWATENRVALIEELTEHWLPTGFTQAAFFSGGSESVDAAVRLARSYHVAKGRGERWKVIGRDVSYHGSTLSGLSVGNHDRRRAGLEPLLHDHPKIDWLDMESFAKVVEREDPETIAAFIGEPISGASGAAMVPPAGYWSAIEEVCRAHDIVLIVDEVMTGFGRTGRTWGFEHFDITPDIIVGGKGLAGGYAPMGGVFTTRSIVDPIASAGLGLMYFTFSGADLGCAVSHKVLQIVREGELIARAALMGSRLRARLEAELSDHPNVADIRGLGLLQGIELVRSRETGEPFPRSAEFAAAAAGEALERGVWLYPCGSGPVVDGLLFGPPYTIDDDHIEQIVRVTSEAITAAAAKQRVSRT
jgi:adenosylmethionine-8-amino-7-oxononanoate aminotransferase